MDNYLFERFVLAMEAIAIEQKRMNDLEESRQSQEFPVISYEGVEDASIFRTGDEQKEPETKSEYESLEERTGRFERLYKAATGG